MKTPTKKFLATVIPQMIFLLTFQAYSAIPNLILAALFIQWCMVDSRYARMARDQREWRQMVGRVSRRESKLL